MQDDIEKIMKLMGNKLKLELCFIISDNKYSLNEVVEQYQLKFNKKKYRETIFRALDDMLKSKLVEKTYDSEKKKIQYGLRIEGVKFHFIDDKIELEYMNKESK